jgi:hypothetical protein
MPDALRGVSAVPGTLFSPVFSRYPVDKIKQHRCPREIPSKRHILIGRKINHQRRDKREQEKQ